jgi:branched-chain amino acid transport system ATP-binding protein
MTGQRTTERPQSDVGTALLDTTDLTKEFGGLKAVQDISFTVNRNEILGFIGPNGAGKSTTFNCVTGYFPPTSGTVRFNGKDITGLEAHEINREGIARTFQDLRPLDDRNVMKNIMIGLVSNKLFSFSTFEEVTRGRAIELAERVGLGDKLNEMPGKLPHEELTRLEIARALACDPELILIDEPFAGLTDEEVDRVVSLIDSLRDEGLTFVIIDHNMRGITSIVDRIVVIDLGEKLAEGTPEEIMNDPAVQQAYLGQSGDDI